MKNEMISPLSGNPLAPDDDRPPFPAMPVEPDPKQPLHRRRPILIGAATLLALVIGAGVWLTPNQPETASTDKSATEVRRLLGATTAVVDGNAEYSSDNKSWKALKADTDLAQGAYIRTAADGRIIVNLDDGSAVRVNNASTVKLASLNTNSVVIQNISGEVYVRVVKSDRQFSVTAGSESYIARGTAYKTINTEVSQGVEVYQSEVSVKAANQTITEGKRYYDKNAAADLTRKITDIPLDQLQKDAFLAWNLEHDKKSSEYKDKLGYLDKLAAQPIPKPVTAPAPALAAASSFAVSGSAAASAINLSWKMSGVSASSFKVLINKDSTPVYGGKGTEAIFLNDAAARSYSYKVTTGKTHNFRICAFNGTGCTAYSNTIQVTAPYVAPAPPTGSLTLANPSGAQLSWTLNGSSPDGLKLVWSATTTPEYPGSSAKYFSGGNGSSTLEADPGTYKVRVCMYYEGGCQNYSNEVTVVIP